jgi:hypothetical protein
MAESKRRDRPKGAELRASLKTKKPVRTPALEEFGRELTTKEMEKISGARTRINALMESAPGALAGSAAGAVAADMVGSTDPYLSRNEFKEGFYDQPKPPVSYETLKGTAAKPIPNITDTESFADGGSVRGQKNIQVKKKPFRGIF